MKKEYKGFGELKKEISTDEVREFCEAKIKEYAKVKRDNLTKAEFLDVSADACCEIVDIARK